MSGEVISPKRIGAILTAYTGMLIGDIDSFHKYAEELLGHEVDRSDFAGISFKVHVKALSTEDFKRVHRWCGGK